MNMKICGKCLESLPEENFAFKNKAEGKLQSFCKSCQKEYRKQHYIDNKDKYKKKAKDWCIKEKKRFFEWLKTKNCVDCGNTDYRVLEFDHLRDKCFDVSNKIGEISLEVILKEVDKCDIVCANCHRIRTSERGNHYNYL